MRLRESDMRELCDCHGEFADCRKRARRPSPLTRWGRPGGASPFTVSLPTAGSVPAGRVHSLGGGDQVGRVHSR